MYVYGGQNSEFIGYSNDMYEYDFDTSTGAVSMTMVNQANAGPNCTFCGAVMINEAQMMVLTHEFANATPGSNESLTVVKPFIFDFTNHTWTTKEIPNYNSIDKNVFHMRTRHSTVLGSDGMIYTIGGLDYFDNSKLLNTSWYYNIRDNNYGIIDNNESFNYTAVGASSFNLPDGNIGSVLGRDAAMYDYHPIDSMMILDTKSKAWVKNQTLQVKKRFNPYEGVTVQTSPDGKLAYFFGGIRHTQGVYFLNVYLFALNLSNNTWISTNPVNHQDNGFVAGKGYASSALISGSYFVAVSGTSNFYFSSESSHMDIFQPPMSADIVEYDVVSSITDKGYTTYWESRPIGSFAIFFGVLVFVFIVIFILVHRKDIAIYKGKINCNFLLKTVWNRRVGESFAVQIYSLLSTIFFSIIFISFIIYFVYNIINSSVSTTEESIEQAAITFPDIRFCYTGWQYSGPTDVKGSRFPTLGCRDIDSTNSGADCQSTIVTLNRTIFTPTFLEQTAGTKCYMYRSSQEVSTFINSNATLKFSHTGYFTDPKQIIYIQLYEPSKNPNRVLFLNEPLPALDVDTVDRWIDSENIGGYAKDTVNQAVAIYPNSKILIQFEVVHTQQIDPKNLWNYVGIFPTYITTSELTITHTEVMTSGTFEAKSTPSGSSNTTGAVTISPSSFSKRLITEKRDNSIASAIGAIGGIIGILVALQAFFFGTRPAAPWGVFQKTSLFPNSREKKRRNLEKYFRVPDVHSVPLVTPVNQRFSDIYNLNNNNEKGSSSSTNTLANPEMELLSRSYQDHHAEQQQIVEEKIIGNTAKKYSTESDLAYFLSEVQNRLNQLEGRNQMLELVLKAYYIDDRIFREVHELSTRSNGDIEDSSMPVTINLRHHNSH